jgi:hypothetical protein
MASATHDTHASHGGEPNYLENNQGKGKLWSWMSTLDHKRIGVMYLFGRRPSRCCCAPSC